MRYLFTLTALCLSLLAFAQTPGDLGMGFQGYARKADGSAISNETIRVKFSIYEEGKSASTADFEEEQNIDTDAYGVFTAKVGSVNTAAFNGLRFDYKAYHLNVQVSVGGSNFVTISDQAFNTVPYAQAAGNGVPAGTIIAFGGDNTKIPVGWEVCDGGLRNPNDAKYAALFAAIGNNWGTEAGQFRLPDLRGQFLRGWANGSTEDPDRGARIAKYTGGATGDKVGTYQAAELQSHNHDMSNAGRHHHDYTSPLVGQFNVPNGPTPTTRAVEFPTKDGAITTSAGEHKHNISNFGGNETRPRNAAVLYIIKL